MRRVVAPIAALLLTGAASAGVVELVSRAAGPAGATQTAAGGSTAYRRCLSADGRFFTFFSSAPNLASGFLDGNTPIGNDVFVHDRATGVNQLVSASVTNPGKTGNSDSRGSVISADGRWIAFESTSTDLVDGFVAGSLNSNIFLFDRTTGVTRLVSRSRVAANRSPNGISTLASVSGDGRWVAFTSVATDFLPGQSGTPNVWNVYVWDRDTGETVLVSHAPGAPATPGTGNSAWQQISADGSTIVFTSLAPNLAPAAGAQMQVYSFDRATGAVRLVSHAAGLPGTGASGWAGAPDVSADGRFISYETTATNVVPSQTGSGAYASVFLWDGSLGTNVLVSRAAGSPSTPSSGASQGAFVSADGAYVVFASAGVDVVGGFVDLNGAYSSDVYLFDRLAGTNTLLSRAAGTTAVGANRSAGASGISGTGARIVVSSDATNLVGGAVDANLELDVFVFDRVLGTVAIASHLAGLPAVTANGSTGAMTISADGAVVAYQTLATNLFGPLVADQNGLGDLGVHDVASGVNALVSGAAPDAPPLAAAGFSMLTTSPNPRALSADGRYVVYSSTAPNLVAGQTDPNGSYDVVLVDRWGGTATLVSHASASSTTAGNGLSYQPALSADGRWVAFLSLATDLAPGVAKSGLHADVVLFDRLTRGNSLVSRRAGTSTSGSGECNEPVVSADGNWIAFSSAAPDLVGGADTNGAADVFLYDRAGDVLTLVSHRAGAGAVAANGESVSPSISADGGVLVFTSNATDLTPGETGGTLGVYAFERATGAVTLVSHVAGMPSRRADGESRSPSVSADGRWAVYSSLAADLVVGQSDTNATADVFLWDRQTGSNVLVSHSSAGAETAGNGGSGAGSLSADGRLVGFSSAATDLVPGGGAGRSNAYLFDRATGAVELVSRSPAGQAGNGTSGSPAVSADGGRVAFTSNATNLVPGFAAPPLPTVQRYVFTRATGQVQLASGAFGSPTVPGNGEGYAAGTLSADGNVFAYDSYATDLVPGDFNGNSDVFVFRSTFAGPPAGFSTLTPCRVVDTRGPAGPWGAPPLAGDASRTFTLAGRCGIPLDAVAVSANVTVVAPAADGAFTFHPAGFAAGGTSTLSYGAGQTRANNAILGLGAGGATAVDVASPGPAHLVLDVNGYFK